MSNNHTTSFWQLISSQKIVIPIIQRDYAQGREGKEHLRERFLNELKNALDDKGTLTLDFVYGVENSTSGNNFTAPLDGQQRLTTLWLLHWYLAYKTSMLENEDVRKILQNFSYETRTSSREFCNQLCNLSYSENKNLLNHIQEQTWFFSVWKQDPTIQSMLRMLCGTKIVDEKSGEDIIDGVDELFSRCHITELKKYWDKLTKEGCPISFYTLTIGSKELPVSDDLYIKMNARGKVLTSFENFKADLVKWIKNNLSEEDAIKYTSLIDNQWTDIFWNQAGKNSAKCIDESFFAFINRYFYNLVITNNDKPLSDKNASSSKAYNYFNDTKNPNSSDKKIAYNSFDYYSEYLNAKVFEDLFMIFSNLKDKDNSIFRREWSRGFNFIPQYLTTDDSQTQKIEDNAGNSIYEISPINQQERVAFYAICKYLAQDSSEDDEPDSLEHWIRFVWNLISETDGDRASIRNIGAMQEAIRVIDRIGNTHQVYKCLSTWTINPKDNSTLGNRFNEEITKAKQILTPQENAELPAGYDTWEEAIDSAEKYAFFKGAIRFLFTNKDEKVDWKDFRKKYETSRAMVPADNEQECHTVRNIIPFLNDIDIKTIFNSRYLSNDSDNLQKMFLQFPAILHNFFMQCDIAKELTLLQKDIIYLCEKNPRYWIHNNWVNSQNVLSHYSTRSGYYEFDSYYIGTLYLRDRIQLLRNIPDVQISSKDSNDEINCPKGLFVDFSYTYKEKEYKFRWQVCDWVDMYDEAGNNLWGNGLHSHYEGEGYNGKIEEHHFGDEQTLEAELKRCCDGWEQILEGK